MFSDDNLDLDEDFELLLETNQPNDDNLLQSNIFRKPSVIQKTLKQRNSKHNEISHECSRDDTASKVVQRKFPGPAGLLPDKPPRSFNDTSLLIDQAENDDKRDDPILCSQSTELTFSEPPFKRLRKDFDVDSTKSVLGTFTAEWVKKKALSKGLKGSKVPFLAVILQSVDCSSADPVITLRDRTGELFGALHSEVWKEMGESLRPGAAIVLKEVGVLNTGVSRRQIILNITRNNIISIYTPSEDGEVIVSTVQKTSPADLIQSVEQWQAKSYQISSPLRTLNQSSPRPNLFKTISSPVSAKPATSKATSNFELLDDDAIFDDIPIESLTSTDPKKKVCNYVQPLGLSQAESSILDEVLSGVDLDDFD